ncbi:phosphomannomutase CpsG [Photobacterium galatheae]|uniref:phosphomannomutase CpsG n=1 Tax=Photobacterium galatheae TaxID=1654360 RepID=UPI00202CAEAA|nr:phosphomannomutase CpsG [Photobacterium galatheae]MCM0147556.1 phosphomannomutase CpsG [Photobacterium galatheae]
MDALTCFKAYDIRGELGPELNEDVAYRIGRAYGQYFQPKCVAVGGDARLTSPALKQALAQGLMDTGVDVIDLGLTGTEEVYFAAQTLDVDGGIEVTASHNPINYNGMKLVRAGAVPVSGDSGLNEIRELAERNQFALSNRQGRLTQASILKAYIEHLLSYISPSQIRPFKLVVNAGNGAAGHVIDALEARFCQLQIPVQFVKIYHEHDGHFPNGIPNPLLPACRDATSQAVISHRADLGIAWDGDFDRCFLFDEHGKFIEGYYIVGLLAEAFLQRSEGKKTLKIIHDPRLTWNTIDLVTANGGQAVQSKTGHAFIKERMRLEDAVYGGEMSAHHYFRDFAYCDSGMIPWLLVIQLLSEKGQTLSEVVSARIQAYPASGEINLRVAETETAIQKVRAVFEPNALDVDTTDGISLSFATWRLNLRASNTEPVLRLNVESRGDRALMEKKTAEVLAILQPERNQKGSWP